MTMNSNFISPVDNSALVATHPEEQSTQLQIQAANFQTNYVHACLKILLKIYWKTIDFNLMAGKDRSKVCLS